MALLGQTISYKNFVEKYAGKKTDYDGFYGVQCVDLILLYIKEVITGHLPSFKGNAKDWWNNRNSSTFLKNNFVFIKPTYKKNNECQVGDIGVRVSGGGGNGHIFIVAGGNVGGKFSYYDQNGGGNHEGMTLRMGITYSASTITGILRPKNQTNIGNKTPNISTSHNSKNNTKDTSAEEIKYLKKILKNKTKVSSVVKNVELDKHNKQNRTYVQVVQHKYVGNGKFEDYYVPVNEGLKIVWERKGAPGQLSFDVLYKGEHKAKIKEGDCIIVSLCNDNGKDAKKMFVGYVFSKKISKDHIFSYTCYDQLRYLKNKDFLIYKGKTATQVVKIVAKRMNMTCGKMTDTKYKMSSIEEGSECFDIIQDALDNTMLEKSKIYVLYDECGKIRLSEINEMKINSTVINKETAEDFTLETSIDSNTYNQIKIVYEKTNKDDNKTTYSQVIFKSSKSINKWGVLQLYEKVDNAKVAKLKAEAYLKMYNSITKSLSVKGVVGDRRVRAGCLVPVIMELPLCSISSYLLVEKVTHTFNNCQHTMDLVLSGGGFSGK